MDKQQILDLIAAKIAGQGNQVDIGGLCLTYTDASTVETVSYDHSESGWAYNSTDKTNIGG
jgi:hypothetical protein